ncbi:MAG TPA: hypothetical protein VF043_35260 [Ktedonobacteraceae bacterium]
MKYIRHMKVGWILLLAVLVLGVSIITPAAAFNKTMQHTAQPAASTPINATFYLATASMQSLFQSNINAKVPTSVNSAITGMINKLPKQDQDWAYLMATTIIQPSATLVSLVPQKGGLAMTLRLSLYPGDPKPITSSMLISFSVLDSSTAQVTATPLNGSPALMSGPLSTFKIPLGSLNSIGATPGCGASALALHLQLPVSLGQASSQVQQTNASTSGSLLTSVNRTSRDYTGLGNYSTSGLTKVQNPGNVNSFVEIPESSLAALSNTIGSMPVGNGLIAQNMRAGVQGSDVLVTTDIIWNGLNIGTAVTTMAPSASGGKMVVHVVNTTLNLFGFIPFPMNSYNAQTEQTLNAKLGSAFSGTYYVTSARIGPNSQLTCAAQNSLVLSGSTAALG